MAKSSTLIIGIAGPSASGKSLFAQNLQSKLAEQLSVAILSADSYYRSQAHLTETQRTQINYDHPDAIEHALLIQHAQSIANGDSVDVPDYSFRKHDRTAETRRIGKVDVLIVEGILVLHWKQLRDLMQLRIFIDVPLEVCQKRRIERDATHRGRSVRSVIEQFQRQVRPMYSQFVNPSMREADLIVPGGGNNGKCVNVVYAWCLFRKSAVQSVKRNK